MIQSSPRSLYHSIRPRGPLNNITTCLPCRQTLLFRLHQRRSQTTGPGPGFVSVVDHPPDPIRAGRKKHGPGLIILALIPITAFALGTWQVRRLDRKTHMIATYEDRLARDPLPLPPVIDTSAISQFDYRRVLATGTFRHDQEMLLGPRIQEGENGFMVITPLERQRPEGGGGSTVLINRGWIAKKFRKQESRGIDALPKGEVTVEGLLRQPWTKNMFTPDNRPDLNEFYFPDVKEMAGLVGAQEVWIEEIMEPELLKRYDREAKGIPIGRPAEVNLRNNHAQYIFTWYALGLATSYMFWLVIRKPPPDVARRVRQNRAWS